MKVGAVRTVTCEAEPVVCESNDVYKKAIWAQWPLQSVTAPCRKTMDLDMDATQDGLKLRLEKRTRFVVEQLFVEYAYVGERQILSLLPSRDMRVRMAKRAWERKARHARQIVRLIGEFLNAPSIRNFEI